MAQATRRGVGLGHDGLGRLHELSGDADVTGSGWLHPIPNLYATCSGLNDPVRIRALTTGKHTARGKTRGLVSHSDRQDRPIWNSLSFVQASGSRDLMQLDGGPLTWPSARATCTAT